MTMKKDKKEQLERIQKILEVSEEEALEILAYDEAVEKGTATDYDYTPEEKKVAKQMRGTGTRKVPTVYNLENGRQRKENPTKEAIIAELAKFLAEQSENACENVEIVNKTRMISFAIGEKSFELSLVEKRNKAK